MAVAKRTTYQFLTDGLHREAAFPILRDAAELASASAQVARQDAATAQGTAAAAQQAANDAAATADEAFSLVTTRARVTYSVDPPASGTEGDLWFNKDTTALCPDIHCKGHILDANGAPVDGSNPHRQTYWIHRWDAAAGGWRDGQGLGVLAASEIAVGSLTADRIKVGDLTADRIRLGGVTVDRLTSGGVSDGNLIANGTSETQPPPGADLTSPEFVGWYQAGAGVAYAGTCVRRFVRQASNAAEEMYCVGAAPCRPGDYHRFTFYYRFPPEFYVGSVLPRFRISYHDAAGNRLGTPSDGTWSAYGGWSWLDMQTYPSPAPADTVEVRFWVGTYGTGQGTQLWVDAIRGVKMVHADDIVNGSIGYQDIADGAILNNHLGIRQVGYDKLNTSVGIIAAASVEINAGTYSYNRQLNFGQLSRVAGPTGTNMPPFVLRMNLAVGTLRENPIVDVTPALPAGGLRFVPYVINSTQDYIDVGFFNLITMLWADPASYVMRLHVTVHALYEWR